MEKINLNTVLAELEINNSMECGAISRYFDLLLTVNESTLTSDNRNALSADIREIIASEMTHRAKLETWTKKLSGIKVATDD